jgi:heme/copper-type cytochrome/quinol oxidase subunit 3
MEAVKPHESVGSAWDGGAFPFAVGHKKLGMWLFIMSDSLTFAAMLTGYS